MSVNLVNLVLYQYDTLKLIKSFFLVTSLLNNVPMLQGEVDCSSFLGEEERNTLHTVEILHNLQNTHKYNELSTDGEELGGIT